MPPTYEQAKAGYAKLWREMTVPPGKISVADKAARGVVADRARYEAVEAQTGVPWFLVACLHHRESGRDFNTYLGNGEPLSRVTRLVPKGRGPFATWEQGAVDALTFDGLAAIKDWPIERVGFCMERFNGWGYIGKVNSPYLWAGSNLYVSGKYVADHVWDASAIDKQLGGMVLLSRICAVCPDVAARLNGLRTNESRSAAPLSPKMSDAAKKSATAAVVSAGVAASTGAWAWSDAGWPVALGAVAGLVAFAAILLVLPKKGRSRCCCGLCC